MSSYEQSRPPKPRKARKQSITEKSKAEARLKRQKATRVDDSRSVNSAKNQDNSRRSAKQSAGKPLLASRKSSQTNHIRSRYVKSGRRVLKSRSGPRVPMVARIGSPAKRLRIGVLLMAIALSVVAGRALQLQALDSDAYAAQAAEKMTTSRDLAANRGQIIDRNQTVLASTEPAVRVFADPKMISTNGYENKKLTAAQKEKIAQAPGAIAAILAKYFGGEPGEYLKILQTKKSSGEYSQYEVIKRKVPSAVYSKLRDELAEGDWHGIFSEYDPARNYPEGKLAANILGFTNAENVGAGGLELQLDEMLAGKPGKESYESSAYGRIPLGNSVLVPAQDGINYQLTLDADLQWSAEQVTRSAVEQTQAESGVSIVMNVKTGEVLAMANYPTFNPNDISTADAKNLGNRAITEAYEPGSVQKVITMSMLVDQGLVNADTKVVVPESIKSGAGKIQDAWSHGTVNYLARGIIADSSNIGTVKVSRQLDKATTVDYLQKYGFGKPTGIELPGEQSGFVPDANMADYTKDQISFGQAISVTAIQEAAAVAAIANGGVYNQPYLLKNATRADGTPVELPKRQEPRRVISKEASAEVIDMMEAVISAKDYAKKRAIPGYRMAGKSGTAQRIDKATGTYRGYTANFIAVAPVEDPQILVYTVLNDPQNGHGGTAVALPVVKDLMQLALPRYGVIPQSEVPSYRKPVIFEP